jgi:hypothetical protein
MRVRRVAFTLVAVALAWPAAAQADDASVWAAWTGHKAEVQAAADAYEKAYRDWKRGGAPTKAEFQAMITADERINAIMAQIQQETAAQTASTKLGRKAQLLSIKSVDLLVLANVYEMRGDRASIEGHRYTAERWYDRCDRVYKVYVRTNRRAWRTWKRAGFKEG